MNQRWRNRLHAWRDPHECINTRAYSVEAIASDAVAKAFILQHHYSGTYPAARFRYGLYDAHGLAGVAVFSHPCNDRVLTSVFDGPALDAVELGRFVLLDSVAGNGETWFLARTFELLRRAHLRGVVSFSDPEPRHTAAGETIFVGHIGTIYQAHNARYLGRGTARSLRLLPDGHVLSDRAIQKIRAGERGWIAAAAVLEQLGADAPGRDRRAWVREWVPRLTRTVRHLGNHKYAWSLQRRHPLSVCALAYPKREAA